MRVSLQVVGVALTLVFAILSLSPTAAAEAKDESRGGNGSMGASAWRG